MLKFFLQFSTFTTVYTISVYVLLIIIHEFCMWPNGYFTSSSPAAAILVRHPLLSLSSTAVVHQYVKNPHLRILPVTSADFLRKIYPQFTCCNIHILPLALLGRVSAPPPQSHFLQCLCTSTCNCHAFNCTKLTACELSYL